EFLPPLLATAKLIGEDLSSSVAARRP
ncbi:MAG: hypothetical protein QOE03_4059, partial [Micromonosporaceae bacterium]|nr:hypothetical protein [Micromonosporaceae bacterium]